LFKAIESFVKTRTGPVLVFDFAIESKTYIDKVQFNNKSDNRFQEILQETRKRMADEL
jgi:hypothetical protein